jgi:hypothetical protein
MGSLVFAIEFAKKLCYKEDSWDGRYIKFFDIAFPGIYYL